MPICGRDGSLFIVDDGSSGGWPALLQSTIRTSQQHVLLFVGVEEPGTIEGDPHGPDRPRSRLRPRFNRHLWTRVSPQEFDGRPTNHGLAWTIRPPSVALGGGRRPKPAFRQDASRCRAATSLWRCRQCQGPGRACRGGGTWPAPGELTALRRRMDGAIRQLGKGRHAPGIRQLRQAIGGLARRDSWIDAGDGALALASSLLRRGRMRDAQEAMEEARRFASRTGRRRRARRRGRAHWRSVDRPRQAGRRRECAGGRAACGSCNRQRLAARECVAGARPLRLLARPLRRRVGGLAGWTHRVGRPNCDCASGPGRANAVGRERLGVAMARLPRRSSFEGGQRSVDGGRGAVHRSLRSLVGRRSGRCRVRDVASSISAARSAHDPLRAIRARLSARGGGAATRACVERARSHLQRLTRSNTDVPPTLQARCAMIRDLIAAPDEADSIVRRHTGATGLGALGLFAPGGGPGLATQSDPMVGDVVANPAVVSDRRRRGRVLKDVCVRVRQQLHAAAVACVAANGGWHAIANDGARFESAIAERAAVRRHHDRAAPVRWADRGGRAGALRRHPNCRDLRPLDARVVVSTLAGIDGSDDGGRGRGARGFGCDRASQSSRQAWCGPSCSA